jgi:hypothetical protein
MKRLFVLGIFVQAILFLQAQQNNNKNADLSKGDYAITNLGKDSINERTRAALTLRNLINGSVIVRLKTNQKSVDAYRKAGKNEIADRIEEDRKKQNLKMYYAFVHYFNFCRVYFIYANETQAMLSGAKGLFLNRNLEHDPSITLPNNNFIFCEYGSVEAYSKFTDVPSLQAGETDKFNKILDPPSTQTSTSPSSTNALFFSDKNLRQFQRPFPYVDDVPLSSYDRAVHSLNRALQRAYDRLVTNKDFREMKKKEKDKVKALPTPQ